MNETAFNWFRDYDRDCGGFEDPKLRKAMEKIFKNSLTGNSAVEKEQKNDEIISFVSLVKNYNDNEDQFINICKKLINNLKTPLVKLFLGLEKDTAFNKGKNKYITVTNVRGIEQNLRKIDGSLIIEMDDEYIDKIFDDAVFTYLIEATLSFLNGIFSVSIIISDPILSI